MNKNYTDIFLENLDNNKETDKNIKSFLQNKISKLVGIKLSYPLRDLQLKSILYYIRKKLDIFAVLPTGYGKTMVAIICALYEKVINNKKTIFIGLYKSLTAEHFETFTKLGIPALIEDGDHRDTAGSYETEDWDILSLTPERFDSLLCNDSKRETLMQDVGLIVSDEIQNLGGKSRGHRMENYIVICKSEFDLRYIYLSATIGNPKELSNWTKSELILSKPGDRPVPLKVDYLTYKEKFYYNSDVPNFKFNLETRLKMVYEIVSSNPNSNFLIFVTSRPRTKQVAKFLCGTPYLPKLGDMVDSYKIAYHSAELDKEERRFVEGSFKRGDCKVIVCTTTLAAGVNLPADHVIMFDVEEFDMLNGRRVIDANRIQQSIGRAGRPGLSEKGFAHIICQNSLYNEVKYRIENPAIIKSQYKIRLHSKILQLIASGISETKLDLIHTISYSFSKITEEEIDYAINWLKVFKFIYENKDEFLFTTKMGKMTNYMYIKPETVVVWARQINSVQDVNDLKELFIRFGSVDEFTDIIGLDSSKLTDDTINYGRREIGTFFPKEIEIEGDDCLDCIFKFECKNITKNKTNCIDKGIFETKQIDPKIQKAYFLMFYDELAPKYLPERKNWKGVMEIKHLPLSKGDKRTLKDAADRIFLSASSIFYEKKELSQNLKLLSNMCKSGTLQKELVELCKLKQISIKRAKLLIKSKINTINEFRSLDSKQVASYLHVTRKVAEKLVRLNE